MHIIVVGLSHKTAPLEIRERVSFSERRFKEALPLLLKYQGILEVLILSTCNRVEVYAVVTFKEEGTESIIEFLSQASELEFDRLKGYLYIYGDNEAIKHLFKVAAGLDSMIIGEGQILGQVKRAYALANEARTLGPVLHRALEKAIGVGKRIRTETRIAQSITSVSQAAVKLAEGLFGSLQVRTVLVLGAGKMSELTTRYLASRGIGAILVANRAYERAQKLAETFQGKAIRFEEISRYLKTADIVISSTSAPHYVIRRDEVAEAMEARGGKKLFLIDIAVPRDIEPEVRDIKDVVLYNIDDLQAIVDGNIKEGEGGLEKASSIIEEEINGFLSWICVQPTLARLTEYVEGIRKRELSRAYSRLKNLTEEERTVIDALTRSLVSKLLHKPLTRIREHASSPEGEKYLETIHDLFDLKGYGREIELLLPDRKRSSYD